MLENCGSPTWVNSFGLDKRHKFVKVKEICHSKGNFDSGVLGEKEKEEEEDKHVENGIWTYFGHKLCRKLAKQVSFHRVMGCVYKALEQIHSRVAAMCLLEIPVSCRRVVACNSTEDLRGLCSQLFSQLVYTGQIYGIFCTCNCKFMN